MLIPRLLCTALVTAASLGAAAHDSSGSLRSAPARAVAAPFDIVATSITTAGQQVVFRMAVSGAAGASRPSANGKLAGARVFSYVWPTTLDPTLVDFDSNSGILAFAVTAHPDFDDTPLFDENGDNDLGNDGNVWHSHWVVLKPDPVCGVDALKVVDIAPGTQPKLPKTWPGLPLLIDSPGWSPRIDQHQVEVRVPIADISAVHHARFDGVTAALRVNASVHDPLLCVTDVFKVASGDLSLPGKVDAAR